MNDDVYKGLSINIIQYSLLSSHIGHTYPLPPRAYRNLRTSRIVEGILSDHGDQKNVTPEVPVPIRLLHISSYFHKGLKGVVLWFSGIQRNDLT